MSINVATDFIGNSYRFEAVNELRKRLRKMIGTESQKEVNENAEPTKEPDAKPKKGKGKK